MNNNTKEKLKERSYINYNHLINNNLMELYNELYELNNHSDIYYESIKKYVFEETKKYNNKHYYMEFGINKTNEKYNRIIDIFNELYYLYYNYKKKYQNEYDNERQRFIENSLNLSNIDIKYGSHVKANTNPLIKKFLKLNDDYEKFLYNQNNLNAKSYKDSIEHLKHECLDLVMINAYVNVNMINSCQDVINDNINIENKILSLNNNSKKNRK